jgi:outer membrane protein assembly factor BamB
VLKWLPSALPVQVAPRWTAKLPSLGHGGVAMAEGVCVVGSRDLADEEDLFEGFDAETGERLWRHTYPAPGTLDYGNSPRATPQIHDGVVYLQGAFGHLTALDLATGDLLWERDLAADYDTPPLEWGIAGSPLLAEGVLVVQPGGRKACLVGLDPETGEERWKSVGGKPSHSSFVHWHRGGRDLAIGFDDKILGAWDLKTGQSEWTLTPEFSGDFNVPTPVIVGDQLFVATENNGAWLYEFNERNSPRLVMKPTGHHADFTPDAHTPVAIGNRLYGVHHGLHCFEAASGPILKQVWHHPDRRLSDYAFLAAAGKRMLVLTHSCKLILWEDTGDAVRELGTLDLKPDSTETLSAPAFVGTRCYVRIGKELLCLELGEPGLAD